MHRSALSPLAGRVRSDASGFTTSAAATPAVVFDIAQRKYSYMGVNSSNMVAPLPIAIAPYMGVKIRTDTLANAISDLAKPNGMAKYFRCRSDIYYDNSLPTFFLAESQGYGTQCLMMC